MNEDINLHFNKKKNDYKKKKTKTKNLIIIIENKTITLHFD